MIGKLKEALIGIVVFVIGLQIVMGLLAPYWHIIGLSLALILFFSIIVGIILAIRKIANGSGGGLRRGR